MILVRNKNDANSNSNHGCALNSGETGTIRERHEQSLKDKMRRASAHFLGLKKKYHQPLHFSTTQISQTAKTMTRTALDIITIDFLSASEKFAMDEEDEPLHLPMRSNVSVDHNTDLSASEKFLMTEGDQSLHAPKRRLSQSIRSASSQYILSVDDSSVDILNSPLSESAKFAAVECAHCLLQVPPVHQLSQNKRNGMLDDSYRSSTLPDIKENASKSSVLEGGDEPLPLPRSLLQSCLKEDAHGDELAMSARFAMAEFEGPLDVPTRQLSESIRTDTLETSSIGASFRSFGIEEFFWPGTKPPPLMGSASLDLGTSGTSEGSFLSDIASFYS